MAQMASSATEHALENQRLGSLQIRVAVICALIQMCDGYDVGSIGWSVPSLTHAWHVAPSAFALAFLWSNIGVMAGALAAGPIGDRIGRKPLLLISRSSASPRWQARFRPPSASWRALASSQELGLPAGLPGRWR
jgi:MFS family permease